MNPLIILVAVLGFITLGGLGFVVAGARRRDPRIAKRARAIATGRTAGEDQSRAGWPPRTPATAANSCCRP